MKMISAHSMEEAEHLCDRLGIFVDGSFQCIGNPKEVKSFHTLSSTRNMNRYMHSLARDS